jgi:hypothetical protein
MDTVYIDALLKSYESNYEMLNYIKSRTDEYLVRHDMSHDEMILKQLFTKYIIKFNNMATVEDVDLLKRNLILVYVDCKYTEYVVTKEMKFYIDDIEIVLYFWKDILGNTDNELTIGGHPCHRNVPKSTNYYALPDVDKRHIYDIVSALKYKSINTQCIIDFIFNLIL